MFKIHTFNELLEIFDKIVEIPERTEYLSIVELKEVIQHLDKRISKLYKTVYHRFSVENHSAAGTEKHLEHCKLNCYQYGYNVIQLEAWSQFLNQRIKSIPISIDYNESIFLDKSSQEFFIFMFENWLSKKEVGLNVLHYVYRRMSIKTPNSADETISKLEDYTIISNQKLFAEFWNKTLKSSHKNNLGFDFKSNGNISFKTFEELSVNSIDSYSIYLNKLLEKYKLVR